MKPADPKTIRPEPLLYNSRIVNNYVRYLEKYYPQVDPEELFAHAGMESWQVADQGHWFSQSQINRFHERMGQLTGNTDIPREVGRFVISSEGMGAFRHYLLSFLSLSQVYAMVGKLAGKVTRSSAYSCQTLGPNRVEITVTPYLGVAENPFQCLNRKGFLESPALFFHGALPKIDHPECLFEGGKCCRYDISWEDAPGFPSKRGQLLTYAGLVCAGLLATWLLSGNLFWLVMVALPTIALGLNVLVSRRERRRFHAHLDDQRDVHAKLLDQIDLTYKNAQLNSELGRVVNFDADFDQTLEGILKVLAEKTDFARGMLFLAEEGGRLSFRGGYGWSSAELAGLGQARFVMTPAAAWRDPAASPAVLVAGKGELEALISALTPGLRKSLHLDSLVACPILAHQALVGLLVVDRLPSDRVLLQSDISVLLGVAPVIGMHIHNHRLLLEMAQQRQALSEEVGLRTADLRESLLAANELAERAEGANLAKTRLLANLSHEIRAPLTGVLELNEQLLESVLEPSQQQLTLQIRETGKQLLGMLDDLLDLSRVETGRLVLERQQFSLLEVVETELQSAAVAAQAKGLEFVYQLAALAGLEVEGDPRRLRQVLLNLVNNAIRFTSKGEVVLRAELLQLGADKVTIRFTVSDTGIGIEPAVQRTIFENSAQGDPSLGSSYGGAGLGLAIVRQLVNLLGGTLGVQSEPGVGSSFWFNLPLKLLASTGPPIRPRLPGRVLLLTGNASLEEGLRDQLRLLDQSLIRVSDRFSALTRLAADAGSWSVVLVDLAQERTSDGSGLVEFCRGLLETRRPVALLGSQRELDKLDRDLDPALKVLPKPVHLAGLVEVLLGGQAKTAEAVFPQALGSSWSGQGGNRILLVEDNAVTRDLVAAMVNRLGCHLTAVASGEQALSQWRADAFDLVLMDCQMPGIDGLETTRRLRALGCETPIVALTARAQKDDPQLCRQAGMNDYLGKPFKQKELLAMIGRWLPEALPPTPS